jgi:fatty-acyl-CoA synthase
MRHPEVTDALVAGRRSDRWGQKVVAIVQLRDGGTVSPDEIREASSDWLARFKLPKDILLVERIRRSAAGKADYGWAKTVVQAEADAVDGHG